MSILHACSHVYTHGRVRTCYISTFIPHIYACLYVSVGYLQANAGPLMYRLLTLQDIDDVKAMFTHSSVTLLALTYSVSMLHVIFDFLAFKVRAAIFSSSESPPSLPPPFLFRHIPQAIFFFALTVVYRMTTDFGRVGRYSLCSSFNVFMIIGPGWIVEKNNYLQLHLFAYYLFVPVRS